MGPPVIWEPDAFAALCATPAGLATLGSLHNGPAVVVDLRGDNRPLDAAPHLPASVVIGFGGEHRRCDVVVDDEPAAVAITAAIGDTPSAAVVLTQLLRLQESLAPHAALTAESLAYATLQGGAEFATWLAHRGTRVRKPDDRPRVRTERRGSHVIVTLDRPRLFNLYDAAMRDALTETLDTVSADPTVRTIDLRGSGKAFCAGGDLAEFGTTRDTARAHLIRSMANVAPTLVEVAPRLTAWVHGAAVGAGVEIAAFANRVVATPDATFSLPEVAMGLVPGAGGTVSVARRIGRQRTAWLALTGNRIDAATARSWGLVDEIADGTARI